MSMRPISLTYTLAAASTTGIATALTGAGPWDTSDFTATGAGDGMAHQLSVTSAANLSAITLTITGTDADGQEISEDVTAPNATTVETTLFFATVSEISADATLGANTMDIGWVDEAVTPTIPLEIYARSPASVAVTLTGTAGFDVEVTDSNIRASTSPPPAQNTFNWFNDANFTAKSASLIANLSGINRALRLVLNSYSSTPTLVLEIVTPL